MYMSNYQLIWTLHRFCITENCLRCCHLGLHVAIFVTSPAHFCLKVPRDNQKPEQAPSKASPFPPLFKFNLSSYIDPGQTTAISCY
ncbi:hypothetical protein WN944_000717 [Citrus x changshan-huyou]|uniref:Uncharacterized protein n=1 Tax=Citrus x changshan-huyou TaxID=2935761 RepID=A0AAP0QU45_9ROSI